MISIRRYLKLAIVHIPRSVTQLRRLDREALAAHYLRGHGIEIGALHNPLKVPRRAHVRFVDRMTVADLRAHYPELSREKLVPVDIIDDGETLSTVQEASQDFVIANHFLEHCENPLGALENMARVLKPDGVLFMCIPDKRRTFDQNRPVTPFEHVERDYREGPAWSRRSHYEEWVKLFERVDGEDAVAKRTQELMQQQYSIHYHVWTSKEMVELFHRGSRVARVPSEIECFLKYGEEAIFIVRKSSAD